jgi:hypothetical protein
MRAIHFCSSAAIALALFGAGISAASADTSDRDKCEKSATTEQQRKSCYKGAFWLDLLAGGAAVGGLVALADSGGSDSTGG